MTKINRGLCVICNELPATTKDHIPPKCLFAVKDRINLLKLSACVECNNHSSKDDEYLRSILILRVDIEETQSTNELRNALIRSLSNLGQPGFQKAYAKAISVKRVFTPTGIFLGNRPVISLDNERLEKVLSKIIRGLYYHHNKKALKREYLIKIISEDNLKLQTPSLQEFIKSKIFYPLDQTWLYEIEKNTFHYKYLLTQEDNYEGTWIFRFYNRIHYLGLVLHEQKVNKDFKDINT